MHADGMGMLAESLSESLFESAVREDFNDLVSDIYFTVDSLDGTSGRFVDGSFDDFDINKVYLILKRLEKMSAVGQDLVLKLQEKCDD